MTGGSNYRKVYVGKVPIHIRVRNWLRARMSWLRWWHLLLGLLVLGALAYGVVRFWPRTVPEGEILATVGESPVSISDVDAEARGQGIPPERLDPALRKKLLEIVINRRVLMLAAMKQGVDKDPVFIGQRARTNEIMLAGVLAQRVNSGKPEVSPAAIQKYIADHPLQFAARRAILIEGLVADLSAVPPARLAELNTVDEIATLLTKLGVPFERGKQRLDTATLPPPVAAKLLQVPGGQAFVLPMGSRSLAGTVVGREPIVLSPAQQGEFARAGALKEQADRRIDAAVARLRAREEIRYAK